MKLFRKKDEYYYDDYDYDYDYDYESEEPIVIEDEVKETTNHKCIKKINILYALLIVIMLMITIDVIGVSRYNVGPLFAIKTHTYKDGGTKEYYGIGYKVIKYHQVQGRRDKVLGSWNLKYNVEPINYNYIDLALDLKNNPDKTYSKIGNNFIRVTGKVSKIKNNKIIITYHDDSMKKYDLDIICTMAKKNKNIKEDDYITIIGTVSEFKLNTNKPNKLYINNCFGK